MKPTTAFETATFKLRPTQRKAAILRRVAAAAAATRSDLLAAHYPAADAARLLLEPAAKRDALRAIGKSVEATAYAVGKRNGATSPIADGAARDANALLTAYINTNKHVPGQAAADYAVAWPDAWRTLITATTAEHVAEARDAWHMVGRSPPVGFTLRRSIECSIITDSAGRYSVLLRIVAAKENARPATVHIGVNATTGEVVKPGAPTAIVAVPLDMGVFQQNKFLRGRATLRSGRIYERDGEWYFAAAFEFTVTPAHNASRALGVDRGITHAAVAAVVEADGRVRDANVVMEDGSISAAVSVAESRQRGAQRRGINYARLRTYRNATKNGLHAVSNAIVRAAATHGAGVIVLEDLSGLKRAQVATKAHGARKNSWQRLLKRMNMHALETMVGYKAKRFGVELKTVPASGTSITCAACGYVNKANRATRDAFVCGECGHTAHADANAAVIIARRGLPVMKPKKGDKLNDLHLKLVNKLILQGRGSCSADDHADSSAPLAAPDANEGSGIAPYAGRGSE